ncbi:MAG: bifunctional demethylmenaquinone methyltransferase/2-methoxy-6-polyprenyl-1,4-benzoquinol methylase UbiE [Spirochaetota bacterium]|nr:bifunctional demethylmenaquinone methyltransferase/2-methoxy-6-polyprenyl-1,4-benzoquinol methylase UbiE [Spirochaetota bacterium]
MNDNFNYKINNIDPSEKKRFIRQLFDSIVPTYDLLNRLLSFGIDILWRRSIIRITHGVRDMAVLDLCCGTGDLSRILHRKGAELYSLDFSHEMILAGIKKQRLSGFTLVADASLLPFKDNSFHIATIAFGIRNIPDIDYFLSESFRTLRPGGTIAILELTRPPNKIVRFIYRFYLNIFIPTIGRMISGQKEAYRYLSKTISTFVSPNDLCSMLNFTGFTDIKLYRKTLGTATIITGKK